MGAKTGIEWTDSTWNPLRGCSRVSEGCRHCYAETTAYRFSGEGKAYAGLAVLKNGHASWTGKVELVEKHLLDPLKWKSVHDPALDWSGRKDERGLIEGRTRPRRIFVNSMSDLFHESVPFEWIDKIFAVMALCPQHTFQVLTKRPKRMLEYLTEYPESRQEMCWRWHVSQAIDTMYPERTDATVDAKERVIDGAPLQNVWLGVSVENQAAADERIPLLLQTPAAVRFISAEPLLGGVDLGRIPDRDFLSLDGDVRSALTGDCYRQDGRLFGVGGPTLDWVICGGESGPGARPMHQDWARLLRSQCFGAGVPFFFKQWGEWAPTFKPKADVISTARTAADLHEWPDGTWSRKYGKKTSGSMLGGIEYKQFPATAAAEVAV